MRSHPTKPFRSAFQRRNHLDLQSNLLAERESTLSLDILRRLAAHLKCPIDHDEQCAELTKETAVDAIAQDLRASEEKEKKKRQGEAGAMQYSALQCRTIGKAAITSSSEM